ncbi:ABC transporter ATP-binding protein [Candidatus Azambacteria bacterium]|nr:ABC transporter ATP-binding protein [Candidatus Azambacteria bacterium]
MEEKIIEVENLSLVYNIGTSAETLALKNISLNIKKEEYVILFGPSGCGKSTLLYTVAGLMRPTSGSILIQNRDITKMSSYDIAVLHRRDMGIVFQSFNLIPTINILDNVALPLTWRGVPKKIRDSIARKLLKRFGLEGQEPKLPQEMSGGQQQRAAIARSLINNAPIIIADEPVGNLDSKASKVVLGILDDLHIKEKKTIILVTHDASLFSQADRIIFLKDGEVVKEQINTRLKTISGEVKPVTDEDVRHQNNIDFATALSDYFLTLSELHLIDNLKKTIVDRLENKLTDMAFEEILARPFRDGGIGMDAKRVGEMKRRISLIMYEAQILRSKPEEDAKHSRLSLEVGELRKYILEDFDKKLSFLQIKTLEETIGSLVRGAIDEEQFKKLVVLPEVQGGVGLGSADAFLFISKLDLVLKLK